MEEEFKYKRQQDWLIDMWSANRRGEEVSVSQYSLKHRVSVVRKDLVWDIVTGKNCPTEEICIRFLKNTGNYIIKKKVINVIYEEV